MCSQNRAGYVEYLPWQLHCVMGHWSCWLEGVVFPSRQPPSTSQSALAKSGVQDKTSVLLLPVISRNPSKLDIHVPA